MYDQIIEERRSRTGELVVPTKAFSSDQNTERPGQSTVKCWGQGQCQHRMKAVLYFSQKTSLQTDGIVLATVSLCFVLNTTAGLELVCHGQVTQYSTDLPDIARTWGPGPLYHSSKYPFCFCKSDIRYGM